MIQSRLRQIARLEKLAEPYFERRRQLWREFQLTQLGAAGHAAILAFLVRYGDPRIDEPLSRACQRVSESDVWHTCCAKYLYHFIRRGRAFPFKPYDRDSASCIDMPLRHMVISNFCGRSEKDKLNAVFSTAPPWLIWYTFGDYTARLLGLKIPDLSTVRGFARSKADFKIWYGVPPGKFEARPWHNDPEKEPLAAVNLNLVFSGVGTTTDENAYFP